MCVKLIFPTFFGYMIKNMKGINAHRVDVKKALHTMTENGIGWSDTNIPLIKNKLGGDTF